MKNKILLLRNHVISKDALSFERLVDHIATRRSKVKVLMRKAKGVLEIIRFFLIDNIMVMVMVMMKLICWVFFYLLVWNNNIIRLFLHLDAEYFSLSNSKLHLKLRNLVLKIRDSPNTSIDWVPHSRIGFIH